ncbi:MAG: MBL fold metallo-hydrolase [Betaproteobacteria bacterium]|nr:MBL fold metallo-hydrolase [Betaproteobacteria bacterium]
MRIFFRRCIAVALALITVTVTATAAILPPPQKISEHAWAWIGPYEGPGMANQGYRMNLGFVVGKQAIAVIDTGYTPEMAQEMLDHIRKLTALPVRVAINTNSQPHRFMGNEVFRKAGARIIAGKEAAARMTQDGGMFVAGIEQILQRPAGSVALPRPPDHLIAPGDSERIDLGGVVIELRDFGRAHTRGSLIVAVEPDRTIFAGDILYSGRLPAILPDSSVVGWLAAVDRLRKLDARVFVPGHGEPKPLASFEHSTVTYLAALKRHMTQQLKQGADLGAATASFDASAWRDLVNFDELAGRNASNAFVEFEADAF